MFCLGCKYPLDGLAEHRCPECGRPFDPADSTSFTLKPLLITTGKRDRSNSQTRITSRLLIGRSNTMERVCSHLLRKSRHRPVRAGWRVDDDDARPNRKLHANQPESR